jgi:hypothetical protein
LFEELLDELLLLDLLEEGTLLRGVEVLLSLPPPNIVLKSFPTSLRGAEFLGRLLELFVDAGVL